MRFWSVCSALPLSKDSFDVAIASSESKLCFIVNDSSGDPTRFIISNTSVRKVIDIDETSRISDGLSVVQEELGKSIGDTDVSSIRFLNKPMQIWEMFGNDSWVDSETGVGEEWDDVGEEEDGGDERNV